jgi:general secretion pathway protein D
VGVKIKVKPRVHFNNDITLDLESEIKTLKAGGDPGRPNLSQRIIKTSARLRDGETAIFGGLLKEDEAEEPAGHLGHLRHPGHRRSPGQPRPTRRTRPT